MNDLNLRFERNPSSRHMTYLKVSFEAVISLTSGQGASEPTLRRRCDCHGRERVHGSILRVSPVGLDESTARSVPSKWDDMYSRGTTSQRRWHEGTRRAAEDTVPRRKRQIWTRTQRDKQWTHTGGEGQKITIPLRYTTTTDTCKLIKTFKSV